MEGGEWTTRIEDGHCLPPRACCPVYREQFVSVRHRHTEYDKLYLLAAPSPTHNYRQGGVASVSLGRISTFIVFHNPK